MQWNGELHAGFSSVEPWLPISDDFARANVAAQSDDPRSILTLYRRLFALRADSPALVSGRLDFVAQQPPLLAYRRTCDDDRLCVVLNLHGEPQTFHLDGGGQGRIVLSTYLDRDEEPVEGTIDLRAGEGVIVALE